MKTARLISMSKLLPLCICVALGAQTAHAAPVALACDMNDDGRYSIADLLAIHRFCKTPPPLVGLPLNDTGIDWCKARSSVFETCPVSDYPGQDGDFGRDVTHDDDSDGHAGFSFTKLDGNGNALPASAMAWSCVRDNVTGLIWEVKTDGGLRDKDSTYTWYNPDFKTNGNGAGARRGGRCSGSACNTNAFVNAVNTQGLCGARDWRLPSRFDLVSLLNFVVGGGVVNIDRNYFPDMSTRQYMYWSSSPRFSDVSRSWAWSVSFYGGDVYFRDKSRPTYVRLVRAGE